MKQAMRWVLGLAVCGMLAGVLYAQPTMTFLPRVAGAGGTPNELELAWSTDPGIRYTLQSSTNMTNWVTIAGFPVEAEALAQKHAFETDAGDRMFFRVLMLDEQPPEIVSRTPDHQAFGASRHTRIFVTLADLTGVDADSIQLTVGEHGTYTPAHDALTFSDGLLVFSMGEQNPLGVHGSTVDVSLVAGDVSGNVGTNSWWFELEIEPNVDEDLFVFGAPEAQIAGQSLSPAGMRIASTVTGDDQAFSIQSEADPWQLIEISPDSLTIEYTGSPPPFAVGQHLANMAPTRVSEIFYRQIVSIEDNPGEGRLILHTTDVSLDDLVTDGSFSLDGSEPTFIENADGSLSPVIAPASSPYILPLHDFEFNKSGESLPIAGVGAIDLRSAFFRFQPQIRLDRERRNGEVQRFSAHVAGQLFVNLNADINLGLDHDGFSPEWELYEKSWWKFGAIGKVPVWVRIKFDVTAKAKLTGSMTLTANARFLQSAYRGYGVEYIRDRQDPRTRWQQIDYGDPTPRSRSFSFMQWQGNATCRLSLVPRIDVGLYQVGDYWRLGSVEALFDAGISASGTASADAGGIQEANLTFVTDGTIQASLDLPFIDTIELIDRPVSLFASSWSYVYPPTETITFTRQPTNITVTAGQPFTLSAHATAPSPVSYQWSRNDSLVGLASQYSVSQAAAHHAGTYHARAVSGGQAAVSDPATVTVTSPIGPVPGGMVLIPGGTNAGTDPDFGAYSLTVSSFYMDRYPVTKALWDEVYNWAVANGYSFDNSGRGKAANHPVHTVSWYDVVKWCNARSQKEGRPAVYTANGAVYKTGRHDNVVQTSAAGYRLPTDTEWEYAARGGLSGRRFPWGDTIQHALANYWSHSSYSYDTSPTRGYHPTYNDGTEPYTSPVGSFAANGYGLYDMTGNAWQWCFDWYPGYEGSYRVLRGGGWSGLAVDCRVGDRIDGRPGSDWYYFGFRAVLPPGQQ